MPVRGQPPGLAMAAKPVLDRRIFSWALMSRDEALAAFVEAAQPKLPDKPVEKLFLMLENRINGTDLNLCDVDKSVKVLHSLPKGAWDAVLSFPEAVNLKFIIASDALFNSGPLVGLGNRLTYKREGSEGQ